MAKLLATCFGIGYIQKGAGTLAALFCCIIWWFCLPFGIDNWLTTFISVFIFALGVWAANRVEGAWGHDSNKVVIDEVLGMCVALLFVPLNLKRLAIAFVLFRFFDIVKPLFIRRAEKLPGGWGVMADDLLAGMYANLTLQLLTALQIL